MTKIAFVSPARSAHIVVYYDGKATRNPYRVYEEGVNFTVTHNPATGESWQTPNRYRIQLDRYADLHSAICYMQNFVAVNNEHGR